MAFDLTKYPRGLISLLGLRDQGKTPQLLSDQLVGVVDANPWFLLQDTEYFQSNTANITGVGSYLFGGTVPAGETWYIHQFQVTVDPVIPAGMALHIRPAMTWRPNTQAVAVGARASGTAGEYVLAMANTPQPIIAPAGASFGWFVEGMTGVGPIPAAYSLTFTRLRA